MSVRLKVWSGALLFGILWVLSPWGFGVKGLVSGEVALLDPPRNVVYTTRAPVKSPIRNADADRDRFEPGSGRRATNATISDTPAQTPGEADQDP
jgi:hypothetical protein